MRVFKRRYTKDGETRRTRKYYVEFADHRRKRHRLPGYRDRAATEALGRRVERLAALRAAGELPGPDVLRWLDSCPPSVLERLADWDLIAEHRAAGAHSVDDLADEFKAHLLAKGGGEAHAKQQTARVKRIAKGCRFRSVSDIDAARVRAWLHEQVKADAFGLSTRNGYVTAFKTFGNWLHRNGRAADNPVAHLSRRNAAPDVRHERRALTADECRALLKATAKADKHHAMDGPQRALLYRVALETGLRWSELHSLTVRCLDLDGATPTVTVEAAYAKNRREDTLPLRASTAALLRAHTAYRAPAAPVFDMWRDKGAVMLREDLKAAKVKAEDERGRVVDFHALRHTFITSLANSGVHPRTAKDLARHSTITLTMDVYTKTAALETRAEAVAALPDLDAKEAQTDAATGTEGGFSVDPAVGPRDRKKWVNMGQHATTDGQNAKTPECSEKPSRARIRQRELARPEGFEPSTIRSEV